MEPHKSQLVGIENFLPKMSDGPRAYFEKALEFTKKFYEEEMNNISSVEFNLVTPEFFLNEYIWVVHATGFSAKAVGKFMPRLKEAYGTYQSMSCESFDEMFKRVKLVCNNSQKSRAVHKTASVINQNVKDDGWERYKNEKLSNPDLLSELPYIGKVTCYHLGRNIGLLECVKPDLHLIRLANFWDFESCEDMCKFMRGEDKIPLGIVDLAVWYLASSMGTLEIRKEGDR